LKNFIENVSWTFIVVCSTSLFIGIVWLLIGREILVVHWSGFYKNHIVVNKKLDAIARKNIKVWYWSHETLHQDTMTIIWHKNDIQENLKTVVQRWLQYMQDENLVSSALTLQTVAVSLFNQQGILSFSGPILYPESSIYKKWHLIEGLCKTISQAGIAVQGLRMLVNQTTMHDDHLDFTQPWSVHGYLTE